MNGLRIVTVRLSGRRKGAANAGVTQLVECNLAKVDVASSSLVTRSPLFINNLGAETPQLLKKLLKTRVEFDRVNGVKRMKWRNSVFDHLEGPIHIKVPLGRLPLKQEAGRALL